MGIVTTTNVSATTDRYNTNEQTFFIRRFFYRCTVFRLIHSMLLGTFWSKSGIASKPVFSDTVLLVAQTISNGPHTFHPRVAFRKKRIRHTHDRPDRANADKPRSQHAENPPLTLSHPPRCLIQGRLKVIC